MLRNAPNPAPRGAFYGAPVRIWHTAFNLL